MKNLLLVTLLLLIALLSNATQDDTVKVFKTDRVPVIDGNANDACWTPAKWQTIDQVWMKWGEEVDTNDFSGKYKVVWSEDENMLYFLVEITDDSFVTGYKYPENNYPDYDIFEVFVDEDQSGGMHVFTGNDTVGFALGTNAYNAFSYHITPVKKLNNSGIIDSFAVCDLDGTSWGHPLIPDYRDHFGGIFFKNTEGKFIWEFSLKICTETYSGKDKEKSRRVLKPNSYLNASVAYCDADDSVGRDSFFGSVKVTKERYNSHWDSADDYGVFYLLEAPDGDEY